MIDNVMTITPTLAREIPQFTIVQIWDEVLSATRLVMCKGHTDSWSVFAYDNGYTFRVLGSDTLSVVTNIQEWESMDSDTRTDIELDLMIRGI
jgi:hypothetical protein